MSLLRWSSRWPSQCAICHAWGRSRLCADCVRVHAAPRHRCRQCALPAPDGVAVCGRCIKQPPGFDAALAALDYAHPWDAVLTRFKFHGALDLGNALADRLLEAFRDAALPAPSLLLPAPLSRERLRERGYNQSWELTRRIARRLRTPASATLLMRVRHGAQQMSLPLAERVGNVRAAFAIEPLRRAELQGREVAVVDDVMTTGATAEEITRVLRAAGASRVQIWALARTPAPE